MHKENMKFIGVGGPWGFLGRWLRLVVTVGIAGTALCCCGQASLDPTHGDEAAVNGPPGIAVNGPPVIDVNGPRGIAVNGPPVIDVNKGELPDAPEPQEQQQTQSTKPLMAEGKTVPATTTMPMAPMYSRVIPAGMATPQVHKWDKITLATRNLYSLTSVTSFFASAGWDHLTNGQPNYGTDRGAFGERLGAAAIRDSSQAFLSNGPFAVWLHQDPRYFALGSHHSIPRRVWYAITRPLITRDSSDGHAVVNTSLILGQAAGTALNNLYYPKSNRNFHDNLAGFGGSMGGSALSFAMDEFTSDLLRVMRLRHGQSSP